MTTTQVTTFDELLAAGERDELVVARSVEPARVAETVALPQDLHPDLLASLASNGIEQLYTHQAEALDAAFAGSMIVTSGTASGKSLCFSLPTAEVLCRERKARALYLYPTKALAQDQARALHALGLAQLRPAIYDGDTAHEVRREIRRSANVILTNPDMLHVGILPHHESWAELFANLAVVVIDEAHVYRGVFGSHVANVIRRLRRIASAYGTEPHFLLASATIANPLELAERLTGLEGVTPIARDGAPRATREIVMWNPPLENELLGTRGSPLAEAASLLAEFVRRDLRTICFMKSRKAVELIVRFAGELLEKDSPELIERIAPYRAGYTSQQRRELERQLVDGELLAVVSTDALELGIDIGELDAAICVTFPGTVASLRQMWGRAGRRRAGLALYIAGEDALDQFFCRHPDEFLERPVEAALIDPDNSEIMRGHLLCAAYEGPLTDADASLFGSGYRQLTAELATDGALRERGNTYVPARREDYPAARVTLRSACADSVAVIEAGSGELIGTVESARAGTTVHDGAVYLHLGQSYVVERLDTEQRRAVVRPHKGDWYTQPKRETDTWIERVLDQRETLGVKLSFGELTVTEQVLAYQRRRISDQQVIDTQTLFLPETSFRTQGLWFELDETVLTDGQPLEQLLGSLHAAEHGQIAVLPLLAMCDRWDIGGLSTNAHPQTGGPTIFIYEGHVGGVGIARRGYECFETLVNDAQRLIDECRCKSGCPSCVQSPKCGNLNESLSKDGALELLGRMVACRS